MLAAGTIAQASTALEASKSIVADLAKPRELDEAEKARLEQRKADRERRAAERAARAAARARPARKPRRPRRRAPPRVAEDAPAGGGGFFGLGLRRRR